MIGNNSSGFLNERQIVNYINNTRYFNNLNNSFKDMLNKVYGIDLTGQVLSAGLCTGQIKPDIFVTINGNTKYFSIKKGSGNSVHQEPLSLFVDFLRNNGINENIINQLKFFHFGDDTIDGTGLVRYDVSQIKRSNPNLLNNVNHALNTASLLPLFFDRFLFLGNLQTATRVDAIYHGNSSYGLWATREEIIDYLLTAGGNPNTLHFGKLGYQVWNRNLRHNPNTENRRFTMQIKWASMASDLSNIREQNNE